ncbi:MAG: YbhB/YbcL family Raf kinase inhibitor-like protein [Gammaproteobacteria bacterium]
MKLYSETFDDGAMMPDECAFGLLGPDRAYVFGANRNPHLAWTDLPAGTRSLVLINDDLDVPVKLDTFNQAGATVARTLQRRALCHWVLVDLDPDGPPIALGEFSDGVTVGGKPGPAGPRGTRQGINEYTDWFAARQDRDMMGQYHGYDGPCPPWNDEVPHRYVFTLYALDVPVLDLGAACAFAKPEVERALHAGRARILAEASVTGLYALNPDLRR